jgi:hypothetical protein
MGEESLTDLASKTLLSQVDHSRWLLIERPCLRPANHPSDRAEGQPKVGTDRRWAPIEGWRRGVPGMN